MANIYLKDGNKFTAMDGESIVVVDDIPVGIYNVGRSMVGYHLTKVDDFILPDKLYGNVESTAMRIVNTHESRSRSTGVLFSGIAGAGKTMTMKYTSQLVAKAGYVTILVNKSFCDEEFKQFISSMKQPAMIVFDEFEKVYDSYEQEHILTLLDGVFESKKLFVFTCNDSHRINSHMLNRPGRIHYAIQYLGLTDDYIRDYCKDNLGNSSHTDGVVKVMHERNCNNFDVMASLVEEMNMYGETAEEAASLMNIGW